MKDVIKKLVALCKVEIEDKIANEEYYNELPCPYWAFWCEGSLSEEFWTGYLFINPSIKKLGIVMVGFEDIGQRKKQVKEREKFIELWDARYKHKFKEMKLSTVIWKDYEFVLTDAIENELFEKGEFEKKFGDCFYFGYVYDFDLDKMKAYMEEIPKSLRRLIQGFCLSKI